MVRVISCKIVEIFFNKVRSCYRRLYAGWGPRSWVGHAWVIAREDETKRANPRAPWYFEIYYYFASMLQRLFLFVDRMTARVGGGGWQILGRSDIMWWQACMTPKSVASSELCKMAEFCQWLLSISSNSTANVTDANFARHVCCVFCDRLWNLKKSRQM